jgi:hypothetical protein
MSNIIAKIENSYGIGKLNQEFDFSRSSTVLVYAPNGVMKTSFTKTLSDYSQEKDPADAIYPDRLSKVEFQDGNAQLGGYRRLQGRTWLPQ